jgi:two-component system, chemotaxis family, chemotaxis protein CheY
MNKIMVVDSSATVRKLLKYLLQGLGYEVLEARDAWEALSSLADIEANTLALVITSLDLKNSDALEFIHKVRSDPEHCLTPILVTAKAGDTRLRKGELEGATAWIAKPFSGQQLLRTMASVLEERKTCPELAATGCK